MIRKLRALKRLSKYPLGNDRLGWHNYYVKVFNKTSRAQAEHLAVWYLFLHLMHEDNAL
ncbi:MAG: hypothetical protein ACKO0Z_10425 [Betaproteobacteria bacterium]